MRSDVLSYKQPRVPEYRQGEPMGVYMRLLMLFLRDFASAVWAANNRRRKEIAALRTEIRAMREQMEGR